MYLFKKNGIKILIHHEDMKVQSQTDISLWGGRKYPFLYNDK